MEVQETVIGFFDRREDADRAVRALDEAGFSEDLTSIVAREDVFGEPSKESPEKSETEKGVVTGSVAGGLAGLLIGIGAVSVPGIGPILASGALAASIGATAAGAGVGATIGALLGALVGMGVSEDQAHAYVEGVRRGGVLVLVETYRERADVAETIMKDAEAVDIEERRARWSDEGWTKFDAGAVPPTQFPHGTQNLE